MRLKNEYRRFISFLYLSMDIKYKQERLGLLMCKELAFYLFDSVSEINLIYKKYGRTRLSVFGQQVV